MTDHMEKVYDIILDVQKQLGSVSRETGEQTKLLSSLDTRVGVANGRTAKNEGEIAMLKQKLYYFMGALAVISIFGGIGATLYIKSIADTSAKEAIVQLEDKYDLQIK